MAQIMQNDFEVLSNKFIHKDSLVKLLNSGAKILAEIGYTTILSIINNVCNPK